MGIVALGASPPSFFTSRFPHADSLAVYAVTPVSVNLAMTFTTKLLRLVEADFISEVIDELVSLFSAVATQTPDCATAMLKVHRIGHDVLMHL